MQVPARFDYEVATSIDEAISLLQRHGLEAWLLAGGYSLYVREEVAEITTRLTSTRYRAHLRTQD